jgi:hypothetical protein
MLGAADDAYLHSISLPRLQHVNFHDGDCYGETHAPRHISGFFSLVPYLQPRLQSLECRAKALTADTAAAQRLVAECPQLRQLRLVHLNCAGGEDDLFGENDDEQLLTQPGPVDDDCRRLLSLLDQLPHITAIGLVDSRFGPCNADLLMHMAARPALAALQTGHVTGALLRLVLGRVARPFSALQQLTVEVESLALPLLVAAVPRLTELKLSFFTAFDPEAYDDDPLAAPPALNCLASLTQLRSLGLAFPDATHLTRGTVQAGLLGLPAGQLRKLSLSGGCDTVIPGYSDSQFAALLARQPRLTSLVFTIASAMTTNTFRIAGESCRELEHLALRGRCYLTSLRRAVVRPLFPRLRSLASYETDLEGSYWKNSRWR